MANLSAILNQYDKATQDNSSTSTKKYDLKNYFTTFLPKGVNTATRTIRLLPPNKEGDSPFVAVMAHNYQIASGEWKTFACLKHENDDDCPFCDTRAGLLADGSEEAKETAKKFRPRKFYVIKLIDRENEADGPKFYRFRENWQKQGTLDKMVNVMKLMNADMSDPTVEGGGRDFVISIARGANGIPLVQTILPAPDKSPLHVDPKQASEWLADTRTWRDVYSLKDYEYLEIIIEGGTPTYDKTNECWVDKDSIETGTHTKSSTDSLDNELELGKSNSNLTANETTTAVRTEAIATVPTTTVTTTAIDVEEYGDDDDMPF
jgi:hypothetical protein